MHRAGILCILAREKYIECFDVSLVKIFRLLIVAGSIPLED